MLFTQLWALFLFCFSMSLTLIVIQSISPSFLGSLFTSLDILPFIFRSVSYITCFFPISSMTSESQSTALQQKMAGNSSPMFDREPIIDIKLGRWCSKYSSYMFHVLIYLSAIHWSLLKYLILDLFTNCYVISHAYGDDSLIHARGLLRFLYF